MSSDVMLRCYDISRGLANTLGSRLLGQSLEGIWHTGVTVFGREFFYGGVIQDMLPSEFENAYGIAPTKVLNLGTTSKELQEFRAFLDSIYHRFTESTYNVLHWNCNHFSNECVKFLLEGKEAPREIIYQHEIIQQSPFGASIIQMIQGMAISNPIGGSHEFQYQPSSTSLGESSVSQTRLMSLEEEERQLNETELGQSLKLLLKEGSIEQIETALETLETLASNIINNSTNSKYRMIKKSNSKLKNSLFDVPYGVECLKALGFEESANIKLDEDSEPGFEFPSLTANKLKELYQSRKLLQSVFQTQFPSRQATDEIATMAQPQYNNQIDQLIDMGFTNRDECYRALQLSNGNINQALDRLMQ